MKNPLNVIQIEDDFDEDEREIAGLLNQIWRWGCFGIALGFAIGVWFGAIVLK